MHDQTAAPDTKAAGSPPGFLGALAQVPSSRKRVDSRLLNLIGVQPVRAKVASLISRRILRATRQERTSVQDELVRAGIVTIPSFLPPERLAAIRRDFSTLMADPARLSVEHYGATLQRVVVFTHQEACALPSLHWFLHHSGLFELLRGVEGPGLQHRHIGLSFEHIVNGNPEDPDHNKEWHTDTFFATHKAWLFLEDVTEDTCPFSFVPGSHRINLQRLKYEYLWSLHGSGTGSWRLREKDQATLLKNVVLAKGPKNTLAVADTCGFHRRSDGRIGAERSLLRVGVRRHPFRQF